MKKSKQREIEEFYKMPFEDIIKVFHIEKQISLKLMADECGISRQVIKNIAIRLKIKTRSLQDAAKLNPNKGTKHFAFGQRKETNERLRRISENMKIKNPSFSNNVRKKIAISMSKTFIKKPWPQETRFRIILLKHKVKFEMQKPVDRFVLDFYIKSLNLAVEIDSRSNWGAERSQKAKTRDEILLKEFGIKTLRINKNKLSDGLFIEDILFANNIIGKKKLVHS